jgi:hypothetical protein
MDRILKIIDFIIWILVVGSIFGFAYGCYELVDLFFIRG